MYQAISSSSELVSVPLQSAGRVGVAPTPLGKSPPKTKKTEKHRIPAKAAILFIEFSFR